MPYSLDKIPTMTSNTTPSGVASASSEYSSSYQAWKAMNDTNIDYNDAWLSASAPPQWLRYQFISPIRIVRYTITSRNNSTTYAPKSWTLQGSNNGSDWTALDTQTNQSFGQNEKKTYDFSNTNPYIYYRLYVTEGIASYIIIGEWELITENIQKTIISDIHFFGTEQKTITSNVEFALTQKIITSDIFFKSQSQKTIYSNVEFKSYYVNKFIHGNYAYVLTDTNPAEIIKVDLQNPTSYTKYAITGKKNGKQIIIDNNRDKLYASLGEGYVAKIDVLNPTSQTIFNVGENTQLNTIAHNPNTLVTYIGDNISGLSEFIIDESSSEVINTDLRFLLEESNKINTYFSTIKGEIINTDLRFIKETDNIINTDLRFNKYTYEEVSNNAFKREDFHVYIDDIQLGNNDLKLDSIQITHTIDNKSIAKFTLLRKHDNINFPTMINENNVVKIYLDTKLEFTGKIFDLDCNSQEEYVVVSCESDTITNNYTFTKKELPLTVLNTQINLYDVLLDNIVIDNPLLDDRLIFVSGSGGRYWTGSRWDRKLSLAATFNTFELAQNYLNSSNDATFLRANPVIDNYERSPKRYNGIRVNLGKKIEESISAWTNLGDSSKNAEAIEDGTFKFYPGFTYYWFVNVILYDLPSNFSNTVLLHTRTALYKYIGTSLSSLSSDLYDITNCFYRYNAVLDDIEIDLGDYVLGNAPYKEISVKNGIRIAKGRWVDKTDGLYWDTGKSYNYEQYDKDVVSVEFTKIKNINGNISPITSANIDLTIDGYLYYKLKLLNRINLINTTVANIYKNDNGFPLSIKQINIDSNSMKISISCDNEYSQGELNELDKIYDNEPVETAESSIRLYRKFDLPNWEEVDV